MSNKPTNIKFESDNGIIKKVIRTFIRDNGNEVRIVSVLAGGLFCPAHADTWALHRDSAECSWALCKTDKHPNLKTMTRQEYMDSGRPEIFRKVTHGELLKNASYIGRRLSDFALV